MTIFTIDEQNNITAFGSAEEAAAATASTCDSFSSQKELAELAKVWPADRLVAIWNSLPGVTPVEIFKSNKVATSRIWTRIQGLREAAEPEAEAAKPKTQRKAKGGARAAKGTSGVQRRATFSGRHRGPHLGPVSRPGDEALPSQALRLEADRSFVERGGPVRPLSFGKKKRTLQREMRAFPNGQKKLYC